MKLKAKVIICLQLGGIKEGDFIVEISGIDVKWHTNKQVTKIIQASGCNLTVKVITPMDRNYLKVICRKSLNCYLVN